MGLHTLEETLRTLSLIVKHGHNPERDYELAIRLMIDAIGIIARNHVDEDTAIQLHQIRVECLVIFATMGQ